MVAQLVLLGQIFASRFFRGSMSRDRVKTKVDRSGEVIFGTRLVHSKIFLFIGQGVQPDGDLEQPGRGGVLQDLDGRPLWRHSWHPGPLHTLRLCLLWHFRGHSLVACALEGRSSLQFNK